MLRLLDVHQIFHPGEINQVYALSGIDVAIPAGQFVTIIGSNGAGKSTLFNAIAGLFPPSKGKIELDGVVINEWPEHKRAALIGRVFQDPLMGTAASMSIAQNLTLAMLRGQRLRLRTGVTRKREAYFQIVLSPLGLGLEKRLHARVSLLSGGQRQALTLVMATMTQPKLLLLDEHTAALDPGTAATILALTQEIVHEQRLTTLMVTHNMHQALTTGDRTLMMDAGEIVLDLSAEQKASMRVQDLVDQFSAVRAKALADDELLLSA